MEIPISQQCSSCDAPAARCWCVDCNEALCDVCVSAHRRVTVTRSHRILNQPQEGGVSTCPTKFCRLHPSEPLKLFCFTCNMLTCRDCQLTAHMNHRYQFVSEALDSLKKELEDCVRPISKQRDAAWKSLQDMETRLRDIADSESNLSSELQRSYLFLTQQIKTRMEDILKNVKTVCETETQLIQTKMNKLKQLLKDQDSVAKFTENAQNSNDVSTLTAYNVQIKSHVKAFHNLNLSPPQRMSQLWVSTDKVSLEAILNFGRLNVNWVPFSVSNTSNQNAPSSSSSSPTPSSPSLTSPSSSSPCPPPLGGPSPQTRTLVSPPATCSSTTSTSYPSQTFLSTSSSPSLVPPPPDHLAPSQKTISDQFVTPPPRTANTDSPVPPNCPATSWKSSSNQQSLPPTASNHSKALMPASTTQTGQHPKKRRQTVSDSENSQRPRFAVLELVQQPLVAQQPATAAVLLSNTQSAYQVSCFALLAAALPLRQIAPGNTGPEPQKSLMGTIVPVSTPGQLTPVPASCPIPPAPTTGNQISVVPSPAAVPRQTQEKEQHQRLKEVNSSSTSHAASRSCEQRLSPDIDPRPSSPKQQQQQNNPVVRAMADSACDGGVQQFAPRRQEPAENEPTSTMSEELAPAGEPSAADESDRDAEEREVTESEAEASETDTGVSNRGAEPEISDGDAGVSDRDAEKPEPVVSDGEAGILDGDNGMSDCSSSQWQPRVSLFRLPVLSQRHKRPLPSFRLIAGEADDEIYLEEMSQETTSLSDDVTDDSADDIGTLSPPGSPLAVQMVACSACRLANASIICMSCGRGFHQDCHIPPVRPDIMSDWICSLCQDLSDPSDPFLSHRPQRPASLGLSLLNQRRCEKLLLLLKVKASSRLSEAHLDWMKDRLTRGSPAYQTAADFLSDVRRLFRDAAPGDFFLNNLQKRMKSLSAAFMAEEKSTAGANVAADAPESERSKVTAREEPEVMSYEARLKETRKRLREALMDGSHSKRRKTEPPPEDSGK
ncbi:hypothetical protein EPR50_G00058270 [Perca flavescens]|uniref:B box-type domain-containing protein n=1 Tax=Perca flavescens TaxID=8167 RepID=A0A484D7K2_PERFV|nr:hypothetical protein EPR50_G00058270 [Perca flavescens]